MFDRNRI